MKNSFAIVACLLMLGLSACSSGSDSNKTVFDGYTKDVNKAKQVQKKVDAAQKKLKEQIKQAESGSGSKG